MKPACGFFLIVFLLLMKVSFGQKENNAALEKRITIEARNETISSVLDKISAQTQIFFSYNAALIDPAKKIDASLSDKTIKEILDIIFESKFVYRVLDDQIIITNLELVPIKKKEPDSTKITAGIIKFSGKIIDREEKEPLPHTSISILKKNIGTISNSDGEFELKIPGTMLEDTVVVSCLGYKQYRIPIQNITDKAETIYLQASSFQLKEIKVTVINPQEILARILSKITLNYPRNPEIMTSFYREVLKQDNNYIDIAEAVMEIRKASYDNAFLEDKVKFIKGRKSQNVKPFQYVDFKIQGGPYYITKLDVVKTVDSFLDPEFRDFYKYSLEETVEFNDRDTYIIRFRPKEKVDYPTYQGKLYVDMSSFALVHAEFELSRSGLKFAHQSLIKKKPKDFYVRPINANYKVSYRRSDGKWHLSNAQAFVNFRVKSKKDKINSLFQSTSDLLITDLRADDKTQFRRDELFKPKDIFSEIISNYDESFWGDYNTIKPSEELRKALKNFTLESDTLFNGSPKPEVLITK
ncbi:MAG: hypothetical protein A2066_08285 [Bacteroidetes bacterium GWB2_41_8]|nr:MAG: hypothetical protein A2066_08285 [Bacteroidetes bacterium GWB2_41_8]